MAQSKSSPGGKSGKPAGGNRPGGKPAGKSASRSASKPGAASSSRPATKSATGRSAAAKDAAAKASLTKGGSGAGRPPNRKKPKSIVNQRQTPWGLIATTAAIVIFAVAIVAVVIATRPDENAADVTSAGGQKVDTSTGQNRDRYRAPELPAAAAIKGVVYRVQAQHNHTDGKVAYDTTPPTGGQHNQYWADCTGTVYDKAIANENAVHMLEHGAIWITYNADDIKGAQLAKLKTYVAGVDRLALSPYPDLKTPISLQAWGYQLKVSSASDPRIAQFIKVLKNNQQTTPEYGSSCSNPGFKEDPSSFGNPVDPAA